MVISIGVWIIVVLLMAVVGRLEQLVSNRDNLRVLNEIRDLLVHNNAVIEDISNKLDIPLESISADKAWDRMYKGIQS